MRRTILLLSITAFLAAILYSGCRKDQPVIDYAGSGYPKEIANIMLTKCAISGCHNTASKDACAGLDLTTWDKMMSGDRNGAICIPYCSTYSTLFLFTNTYPDLGNVVPPSMPYLLPPLSREEEIAIRNWIDAGAPNSTGFVKWSDAQNRSKFWITNQGCDVVLTVDAKTRLQMRAIPVGADGSVEGPHDVVLSPDGKYWYVCFVAGKYLEKYRTSDDAFVGRALLGYNDQDAEGSWNTIAITDDGKIAEVVDWSPDGSVAFVDLDKMKLVPHGHIEGTGLFVQPHGSNIQWNPTNDTLFFYATGNAGNLVYKIDTFGLAEGLFNITHQNIREIPVDGSSTPINSNNSDQIHQIEFRPDGTEYFCSAQHTNCIRVMNAATDHLITTIPVGGFPQEMEKSETMPYLYVTCEEDTTTYPGLRGSVYIINYETNTLVGHVYPGYQPHGITVDDDDKIVLVANRNVAGSGPAPHHTTACGGRDGYITFIDMNTNQAIEGDLSKIEMAADPYECAYKR